MIDRIFAIIMFTFLGSTLFNIATAAPTVDLKGTSIIGEQESPKVRYTIPWQKTQTTTLPKRPWVSLIKHELRPIDRETFQQQLQLDQLIQPNE